MTRTDFDNLVKRVCSLYPSYMQKADAVIYVCRQTAITPDAREALWRFWCKHTRTSVLKSDVDRVREARQRDQQTSLF